MPRVETVSREQLSEFEDFFQIVEQGMGFLPNSMLTLGRSPDLLRAFAGLSAAVLIGGTLSQDLKSLVSFVASNAAGCRYCQAHTAHSAERAGVGGDKLDAAFEFETSPLFSDAERAALRVARDAAFVPNATTDEQFASLRKHYNETEIVELVAVISLFGWLNRWNDTMATELESGPLSFASGRLSQHGWQVGKHGSED
jgi:uncharacterized peroxidase-related enzyme